MIKDVQWVLLWSDMLFWGLAFVSVFALLRTLNKARARRVWQKILVQPAGMGAMWILLAFILVAMTDSIHFRQRLPEIPGNTQIIYAPTLTSALDVFFQDLHTQAERTYSAPLATHLFTKETIDLEDGSQTRTYPRLKYAGGHLANTSEHKTDLKQRFMKALLFTFGMSGFVGLVIAGVVALQEKVSLSIALKKIGTGEAKLAWRTAWGVLSLLALVVCIIQQWVPAYHLLGTDKAGQDVFYLSLKAVRTAVLIGTLTTLVLMPVALLLGILAGYLGGWVDDVVQYLYTVLNSIPGVLLIAASVLMIQTLIDTHPQWFSTAAQRADARLMALCLILGMTSWTGLCRLLRAEVLKLRELEFIQAARAFNVGTWTILRRHLLPNVMHIVLITLVLDFSGLVLAEAVLSYIGIGVDPDTVSFGTMIDAARAELARDPIIWWPLASAFSLMFILVLSANLFSDAVRDALDPQGGDLH